MSRLLQRARKLRRNETETEQRAWWLLRDRQLSGLKFRRQHRIGKYIVDFYCVHARLAVELEGSIHSQPSRMRKDAAKDAFLRRLGVRILGLPNGMVVEDRATFLRRIQEAAEALLSNERR